MYGPTDDGTEQGNVEFMEALREQIEKVKDKLGLIIIEDLNGRTGRKGNDQTVGRFGEETVNESCERIKEI